jgi:hypothetical protein
MPDSNYCNGGQLLLLWYAETRGHLWMSNIIYGELGEGASNSGVRLSRQWRTWAMGVSEQGRRKFWVLVIAYRVPSAFSVTREDQNLLSQLRDTRGYRCDTNPVWEWSCNCRLSTPWIWCPVNYSAQEETDNKARHGHRREGLQQQAKHRIHSWRSWQEGLENWIPSNLRPSIHT